MSEQKKRIAVFFGGRSPEHDVSIVTGLQAMKAIDPDRYEAFPVYIARDGRWFVGDYLRTQSNYIPSEETLGRLTEVTLDVDSGSHPILMPKSRGIFSFLSKPVEFDVAFPAFHGLQGEDGHLQGMFEIAGVPYCGPRPMAAGVYMDKEATKHICRSLGVPVLPCTVLRRPAEGYFIPDEQLAVMLEDMRFPCIVKPSHLGSSIGVAKANSLEEVSACLPAIFEFDFSALVEPYVSNLVEYNVAVTRCFDGEVVTSAIERPKSDKELLDFREKYMSGGGNGGGKLEGGTGGTKTPGESSEGMLSLTREINPKLDSKMEANIRNWSAAVFAALDGCGAPRIDYLCNSQTGELWFNEVNPIPGSFGFFLWEAAAEQVMFTDYLTCLIEEALQRHESCKVPADPVPMDARLFKRN